jgi:hypothetical protein
VSRSGQGRAPASRLARGSIVGLIVVAALAGCGRGIEGGGIGSVPDAETPRASAGPAAQATIAALGDALAIGGYVLEPAGRPFQPAQPAALIAVPRSAYQVRLSDPDGGVVLVYEFPTAEAARTGAAELADYLSSGPGKINFAGDTLFHVASLGPTVIMSWFSASQSDDPEAARGAFDLVSTVGADAPVLR